MNSIFSARRPLLPTIVLCAISSAAWSASIEVQGAYHYLDNRSPNSINILVGVRENIGATAVILPPGANHAQTVGTTTPVGGVNTFPLNFSPFDTQPNHFLRSLPVEAFDGRWTLNFVNGAHSGSAITPGGLTGLTPMGFVSSMAITPGTTPTFSWTTPNTPFDTQRVIIRDTTDLRGSGGIGGDGIANAIFSLDIGKDLRSFTVNPNDPGFTKALEIGKVYSFELNLRDLRNPSETPTLANTLNQSRSFFDFMLLPSNAPAAVFLPMTDARNPAAPVYEFKNIPVATGQTVFIDPLVAIGYDYQIALGDPNFASVTLPTGIGDNKYSLWLWDGDEWALSPDELFGGSKYSFGGLGVDRFRILGIEIGALLDPLNPLAFITGLSFVADGTFNGTMTAITFDTPLPAALPLFATILAGGGLVAWRRNRKAKRPAA